VLFHWSFPKKCPHHKGRKPQHEHTTANMVTNIEVKTSGYSNLPSVLSVFLYTTWWLDTGANVHVCYDASLFSSYHVTQDSSMMMGNWSHASIHGAGTQDSKLTSGKIMQHVPTTNKNIVSGPLLCRNNFKLVLESNKFVLSKCG
jgi:hypothetical protein